jgi:tetratricopeptide (TPR) repeat protein
VDYDIAIRLDPNNADIFNNRAAAMIYLQDYGRAIEDLDHAIRLNPSYSEAFVNRGLANAHQREYERAIGVMPLHTPIAVSRIRRRESTHERRPTLIRQKS